MKDEEFRALLLEERERVAHAINYLQAEIHSLEEETSEEPYEGNIGGGATITLDREIDTTLEENSEHVLRSIDEALERLDAGTFGLCAGCGQRISIERLRAMPYATKCIECKRTEEKK